MRVGFYQFNPIFGEVKQNLDTVFNRLMKVEADLIVLPELCMSGYQFTSKEEVTVLAEEVPHGPTTVDRTGARAVYGDRCGAAGAGWRVSV